MTPSREQRGYEKNDQEQEVEVVQAASRTRDQDVDALLDEIDDVLEQNAEAFVKGFVQKGGE